MAATTGILILNHKQIEQKIRRIAYQIYENNIAEKEIILAGITKSGYKLAQKLNAMLQEISSLQTLLCKVEINKTAPLSDQIKTSLPPTQYQDKSIVIIDDVLNSGATLMYGCKHFLEVPVKKLQTAVLVDRSHKKFPINADFKGVSLSTSLNEMVQVNFTDSDSKVLLF